MAGSGQPFSLTILGQEITFRAGADKERIREAAFLLEDRYEALKGRVQGLQPREILLTHLALAFADELLKLKCLQAEQETKLASLLAKIEKSL